MAYRSAQPTRDSAGALHGKAPAAARDTSEALRHWMGVGGSGGGALWGAEMRQNSGATEPKS